MYNLGVLESGLRFANKYQLPDKSIPQVISFNNVSSLIVIGDGILGNIYMYNIDGAFCSKFVGHSARFHPFLGSRWGPFLSSSLDGRTIFWNVEYPKQSNLVAQNHEHVVYSQLMDCGPH